MKKSKFITIRQVGTKIDGLPIHRGLCFKHRLEHPERSVSDALGKAVIRHHSSDAVHDENEIGGYCASCGGAVMEDDP